MTARNRTTRKAAKPRVGKYIAIVALMLVVAGIAASVSVSSFIGSSRTIRTPSGFSVTESISPTVTSGKIPIFFAAQ